MTWQVEFRQDDRPCTTLVTETLDQMLRQLAEFTGQLVRDDDESRSGDEEAVA